MRHPHADMIIEWVNDTSKQPQLFLAEKWCDCGIQAVAIGNEKDQFRFKPREFNEGEWYQVVTKWTDGDEPLVLEFVNGCFYHDSDTYDAEQFRWIGESLGKLKFGA